MAEQPRGKGQYVQAGMYCLYPTISSNVVSHDGTLALDTVYLQDDYPVLFEVLGTHFNDSSKGDNDETQFRTPPDSDLPDVSSLNCEWRIRF